MKRIAILTSCAFLSVALMAQTSVNDSISCDSIQYHLLNEIVISPKNISRNGLNYKINNVQSTFLAETGDIFGMLKRTPGIIVSADQSISVIGSGKPIIYIDGRRIISDAELTSIPTSNIKGIEIIRQPGIEYPSGTSAVIKLTTIKRLGQYAALSLRNSVEYTGFLSEIPSASLNIALGKWSFLAGMSYRYGHSLSSYNNELSLHSDNGIWQPVLLTKRDYENKANTYSPMFQIGFNPNEKSAFIATYNGRFVNRKPNSKTYNELDGGNIYEIQTFPKNTYTAHTASAGYTYNANNIDKFNFFVSYQRQESSNNRNILLLSQEDLTSFFNRNDNTDLFSANTEYVKRVNKSTWTFGAEYGYIKSVSAMAQEDGNYNIHRTDQDYSVYILFAHRFPNFSLNVGARLSGLKAKLSTLDFSNKHLSVYPSLNVRYYVSDNYTIGGSISRNTFWPTLLQLNPNYNYTDAYHVSFGNVDLKPITWSRFMADCNIKDLTISFTFVNRKDCIIQTQELANNVILEYPINANWKNDYTLQADYDIEIGKFEMSFFGNILYSVTKIPDWNNYLKNVCVGLSGDFNWSPIKNLSLYSSWYYQSPSRAGLRKLGYQLDASVGATLKLINKKLTLSLEANDLFNRSILPTSYTFTSTKFIEKVHNNYHGRGVTFSVRYNFDSAKTKFIFPKMSTTTTNRAIIE